PKDSVDFFEFAVDLSQLEVPHRTRRLADTISPFPSILFQSIHLTAYGSWCRLPSYTNVHDILDFPKSRQPHLASVQVAHGSAPAFGSHGSFHKFNIAAIRSSRCWRTWR